MNEAAKLFLIKPENGARFSALLTPEAFARLDDPKVLVLGAELDGLARGAIAAEFDEIAGDILSLFVAEGCRRRGLGRALVEGLSASAKRVGARELQTGFDPDAAPELTAFFTALGFEGGEEIPRFRFTLGQLQAVKLPSKAGAVTPLGEVPKVLIREYNLKAARDEDGSLLPLDAGQADPVLSSACLNKDGRLGGFVAVARRSGGVEIANVYAAPECRDQIAALFRRSLEMAGAALPPETPVIVDAVSQAGDKLLRHLAQGLEIPEGRVTAYTLRL